jgi:hypothetical protein
MQHLPPDSQLDCFKREEVLNKIRNLAREVQDRVNRVLAEDKPEESSEKPEEVEK